MDSLLGGRCGPDWSFKGGQRGTARGLGYSCRSAVAGGTVGDVLGERGEVAGRRRGDLDVVEVVAQKLREQRGLFERQAGVSRFLLAG